MDQNLLYPIYPYFVGVNIHFEPKWIPVPRVMLKKQSSRQMAPKEALILQILHSHKTAPAWETQLLSTELTQHPMKAKRGAVLFNLFTYKLDDILGQMLVNIPAPWSKWALYS